MKKIFLLICLIGINSLSFAQLLDEKMKPATDYMHVKTWQPKPSLLPLLDKYYVEASQTDPSYQVNVDFFNSFSLSVNPQQLKSEEEKLKVQRSHRYLSIYLHFALDLLREREDLVLRFIANYKENYKITMTVDELWDMVFDSYGPPAPPEFKIVFFFMSDIIFEKEVENYVEVSLKHFYNI